MESNLETINDLQKLCNFASSISNNQLHQFWVEILKTQTNNKSLLNTYDLMISKLQSNYLDEFDDPASIAEETWGIGSAEMFSNPVTLHRIYYNDVVTQIKIFFINEIFILSTNDVFQNKAQRILNNFETFYTVPDAVFRTHSKCSFHHDSGKYHKWKIDRNNDVINKNIKLLKELLIEYGISKR